MKVYVLVPTAVYDHGIVGVYTSEQAARDAAARIWPHTDGHHRFEIRARQLDVTYNDEDNFTMSSDEDRCPPDGPLRVEVLLEPPLWTGTVTY